MGDLAAAIIDPSYKDMKTKFPTSSHDQWECMPLPQVNLRYAAIDGYVSFELYRRLKKINDGQRQAQPIPREVVCPDCKEAARLAALPPAWRDEKKQCVGTTYWEFVSYCFRHNIPFDPKNMPPWIKAPCEPTSGSLWDGGSHGEQASTTRKVSMADEVEVAPWLLVHHGRRFFVPPWCMSKLFFLVFEAT
jgi:hypothetical protein